MDISSAPSAKPAPPKRENVWANFGFNIILPALIMTGRGQKLLGLSPVAALLLALAFPLAYGLYDLWKRRIWNVLSIIGLVALAVTGGIGLLKLDPQWVAIKDGAVPLIFGLIIVGSLATKKPLVQALLLNPSVIDVPRVEKALEERQAQGEFRKLLWRATLLVAVSFLLHAVLNYFLARHLVHSPAGTPEFTAEIGRMTALSWPLIILPTGLILVAALFYLLNGLKKVTGLEMEDMFHEDLREEKRPADAPANTPPS